MSIFLKQTNPEAPLRVDSPEAMTAAIKACGIVPFFESPIAGYSIEEMTPREYWFDGEEGTLGPWDWKIEAVQTGEIAYGKFLCGGKAAFQKLTTGYFVSHDLSPFLFFGMEQSVFLLFVFYPIYKNRKRR